MKGPQIQETALVLDVGDRYRFGIVYRDENEDLSDPTTVTLRLRKPDGTILGPWTWAGAEVVRDSEGVFSREHTLDLSGIWTAEWVSTGTPTLTTFEKIVARESQIDGEPDETLSPRALVTLEAALDYCEIGLGEIGLYDEVIRAVNAVTRRAYGLSGREFRPVEPATGPRTFDVSPSRIFSAALPREIRIGDLAELDAVSIAGTALDVDQLAQVVALPRNREEWEPIRRLRIYGIVPYWPGATVEVTGTWGFPSVPDDVRGAALRQIKYWLDRDLGKFSETFQESEGAAATNRLPDSGRSLLRSVYDVFAAYRDVGIRTAG